jgi:hypothetical protein
MDEREAADILEVLGDEDARVVVCERCPCRRVVTWDLGPVLCEKCWRDDYEARESAYHSSLRGGTLYYYFACDHSPSLPPWA